MTAAHRETPDVAELRRLYDKCQPGRVIVNDLRREHHAIWLDSRHDDGQWTTLRTLAEIDTETETVEVMWGLDDAVLMAGALNALPELLDAAAERDVLADRLAHMTEARDNARAEVKRLTAKLDAIEADGDKLSIMFGWLVYDVGEHTCGGYGPESGYAHEPGCGFEPVLRLDKLEGWPGEKPLDGRPQP